MHLGKIIWEAIPLAVLWTLWTARNGKAFDSKEPAWDEIVECIKINVTIWVKFSTNPKDYEIHDFCFAGRD
ncbi:hypothetical protein ACSBR1_004462 [Camellia fascicularis]